MARRFVDAIGAENLRAYAQQFDKKPDDGAADGGISKEKWRVDFEKNGVLRIHQYIDGIQIVLESHDRRERGVYLPYNASTVPDDGSGINFEMLAPGIYCYEEKIRDEFVPPK